MMSPQHAAHAVDTVDTVCPRKGRVPPVLACISATGNLCPTGKEKKNVPNRERKEKKKRKGRKNPPKKNPDARLL